MLTEVQKRARSAISPLRIENLGFGYSAKNLKIYINNCLKILKLVHN